MKVLILGMENEFIDNSASGIVKYMHSLYSEMGKINGIEVHKSEYKKISKKLPWANHLAFYFETRFSNFKNYDILHNPNNNRIFVKPKNTKLVTTIHNVISVTEKARAQGLGIRDRVVAANANFSSYIGTKGLALSLKSDHIIADTLHGKEEILRYADGYDKNRISVVNLGIDEEFMFDKKDYAEKSKKTFKIGYLGSFNHYQNMPSAIRVVKMLKDPEIRFEMWGDRTIESHRLDNEIIDDKRISFMGKVSQGRKVRLYESFDLFIHSGIYEGLPILEAMARGVPVLVYKRIKMDRAMRRHCFIAEDEAHMAQIVQDIKTKGYNQNRRRKAIAYARGFTWKRTAEDTVRVYEKVLGG